MGKLTSFVINLNIPKATYKAGDLLEGHVRVTLTGPMKTRGVKLQFTGGASVHWSESHTTGSGKNRRTETRHYSACESYFNLEYILFGPTSGSTTLPAGSYTYPFSYQLPRNLPSSFEGGIGNVRYQLKARIDKPWKFDHKTKKIFTVVSLLDLNQQPSASLPVQGEDFKNLCCLCCKSGPITAKCHVDRAGYVPGDTIHVNAEIINNSSRRMKASRAKLFMVTTFHATAKSKMSVKCVAEKCRGGIDGYKSDKWSQVAIVVPPVPPSFLAGCTIIDIKYTLQLEVDPAGPAFDLVVPLDIIIGTIPLRQVVQQLCPNWNPAPRRPSKPSARSGSIYPMQPPDLPPPSYSECVFGKVSVDEEGDDNEHMRGDKQFVPNYAYYDWTKSGFK